MAYTLGPCKLYYLILYSPYNLNHIMWSILYGLYFMIHFMIHHSLWSIFTGPYSMVHIVWSLKHSPYMSPYSMVHIHNRVHIICSIKYGAKILFRLMTWFKGQFWTVQSCRIVIWLSVLIFDLYWPWGLGSFKWWHFLFYTDCFIMMNILTLICIS